MIDLIFYDENEQEIPSLTQWDLGRVLYIRNTENLVQTPVFHFYNRSVDESTPVLSEFVTINSHNYIKVNVPNEILQKSLVIHVHIGVSNNVNELETIGTGVITVIQKVKPSYYEYVQNIADVFDETISRKLKEELEGGSPKGVFAVKGDLTNKDSGLYVCVTANDNTSAKPPIKSGYLYYWDKETDTLNYLDIQYQAPDSLTFKKVDYSDTVFDDNTEDNVFYRTDYDGAGCLFFHLYHGNRHYQYRITKYNIQVRGDDAKGGWNDWENIVNSYSKSETDSLLSEKITIKEVPYSAMVFNNNFENNVFYRTEYNGSGCLFFYLFHGNRRVQYRFTQYGVEYRTTGSTLDGDSWRSVGDIAERGSITSNNQAWYSDDSTRKMTGTYELNGDYCTLSATAHLINGWSRIYYSLPVSAIANSATIAVSDTNYTINTTIQNNISVLEINRFDRGTITQFGTIDFVLRYKYK